MPPFPQRVATKGFISAAVGVAPPVRAAEVSIAGAMQVLLKNIIIKAPPALALPNEAQASYGRRFRLLPEIGLVREITLSYRVTREAPGRDPGRRRG